MTFSKNISPRDLLEFNKSLSLLLYAKIGFVDALEIVYPQIRNDKFKKVVKDIIRGLKSGTSISKCFAKHPALFPEIFIATLRVGEETGELGAVIGEFTRYNEKIQRVKQKALVAIRYPLFVIFVLFTTLFFMVWFLIPNFEGIFLSFGKDIPSLSRAVFSSASWIRNNILFILAVPSVGLFLIFKYTGKEQVRKYYSVVVPYLPVLSRLYKLNILARFSFTMNTLLKNRVTLVEALKIARSSNKDPLFLKEIDFLIKSLVKGQNFSQILGKSKFFDVTFIQLLTAAEGASELDKAFLMTADFYTDEFDDILETLTSFMEPALILFIGFFVGTIVVALYLPMFELLNNFGF